MPETESTAFTAIAAFATSVIKILLAMTDLTDGLKFRILIGIAMSVFEFATLSMIPEDTMRGRAFRLLAFFIPIFSFTFFGSFTETQMIISGIISVAISGMYAASKFSIEKRETQSRIRIAELQYQITEQHDSHLIALADQKEKHLIALADQKGKHLIALADQKEKYSIALADQKGKYLLALADQKGKHGLEVIQLRGDIKRRTMKEVIKQIFIYCGIAFSSVVFVTNRLPHRSTSQDMGALASGDSPPVPCQTSAERFRRKPLPSVPKNAKTKR